MNFLPVDIENIIMDYKKQFERKYDCGIKHQHHFLEKIYKKNITFHENPYKFECQMCKMKICSEHTDEFIKQHTKKNLCSSCYLVTIQKDLILKDIEYNKKILEKDVLQYKSQLFFFKDENLNEINELLKEILNETGEINEENIYESINTVYNKLQFFDFFQGEI